MAEELDVRHADDFRAPTLLFLAERPDNTRLHAVDPGLAARGSTYTRPCPAVQWATPRDAVLEVVGVRDDRHGALPVFRYRLQLGSSPSWVHSRDEHAIEELGRRPSPRSTRPLDAGSLSGRDHFDGRAGASRETTEALSSA